MKKLLVLAVVLLVIVPAVSVAVAEGGGDGNPAIVIHEGACLVPGVDAYGDLYGLFFADQLHLVENKNQVKLMCHGTVPNHSGQGQVFRGELCGILIPSDGYVLTDDTHVTVSASGQVVLACTFKK